MIRSRISVSSSELAAGAGSTRRGVQPALRRDMSRGPDELAGWRAGGLAGWQAEDEQAARVQSEALR